MEKIASDPHHPHHQRAVAWLAKEGGGHEFHGNQYSGGGSGEGPQLKEGGHTGISETTHNGVSEVPAKLFSGEKNSGQTGWQGVERGTLPLSARSTYDSARDSGASHHDAMQTAGGKSAFGKNDTGSHTVAEVHAAHGLTT